jgi:hypothetical protein
MPNKQTIVIESHLDVVEARVRVRSLAREVGLDLFDQARISLATSTLAIILGMEKSGGGSISMEPLEAQPAEERRGVQVTCLCEVGSEVALRGANASVDAGGVLDDARRMVDDLLVRAAPDGGIEVTLIKWAGRSRLRPAAADLGRSDSWAAAARMNAGTTRADDVTLGGEKQ